MNCSYVFINSKFILNVKNLICNSHHSVRSISSSHTIYSRRFRNHNVNYNNGKFQEKADLFVKYLSIQEREILSNSLSIKKKKPTKTDIPMNDEAYKQGLKIYYIYIYSFYIL